MFLALGPVWAEGAAIPEVKVISYTGAWHFKGGVEIKENFLKVEPLPCTPTAKKGGKTKVCIAPPQVVLSAFVYTSYLFGMADERKSALKHERALTSSPLQAPGLKAAKVGESGVAKESADDFMGGFGKVPQFPRVVGGTAPIDDAMFGATGSSGSGPQGKGASGGLLGDETMSLKSLA